MTRHYGLPQIRAAQPQAPLQAPRFCTSVMTELVQAGAVMIVVLFWAWVFKFVMGC